MLRSAKYGLYGAVLAGLVGGSALWHQVDKSVTLYVDGRPIESTPPRRTCPASSRERGLHARAARSARPCGAGERPRRRTVVLKHGRLLRLTIDGVGRDVWTTAPTVAAAMEQLGYSTANFTSVSRSKRLPLGSTAIAIRTPKVVSVAPRRHGPARHHDGRDGRRTHR